MNLIQYFRRWCISLAVLSAWLKKSGTTGAVYRRSDWEYVRRLSVRGYATGIRFEKAKVPTNAVIAGSDVAASRRMAGRSTSRRDITAAPDR